MDEQVGRMTAELKALGVADNTMLWFSSDNGPENGTPGSAGPYRGRKRSLYEGGVRVPGLLVWPARIKKARRTTVPCCTSDYFPTVLDVLGFRMKGQPTPIDGVSLVPLIDGTMTERPRPIGFQSSGQATLSDNRYKLYTKSLGRAAKPGKGKGKGKKAKGPVVELYDLLADPYEKTDLAAEKPEIVEKMKKQLLDWMASCAKSSRGGDYTAK
jgi:arylsulfatase A-like enzyme